MSGIDTNETVDDELVFESDLDAPPDKVWRAMTIPELRDRWLPDGALADPDPVRATPGEEVTYRMKDDEPPYLESTVTIQVRPGVAGDGTRLRIIHRLADARLGREPPVACNSNGPRLLRAA